MKHTVEWSWYSSRIALVEVEAGPREANTIALVPVNHRLFTLFYSHRPTACQKWYQSIQLPATYKGRLKGLPTTQRCTRNISNARVIFFPHSLLLRCHSSLIHRQGYPIGLLPSPPSVNAFESFSLHCLASQYTQQAGHSPLELRLKRLSSLHWYV